MSRIKPVVRIKSRKQYFTKNQSALCFTNEQRRSWRS